MAVLGVALLAHSSRQQRRSAGTRERRKEAGGKKGSKRGQAETSWLGGRGRRVSRVSRRSLGGGKSAGGRVMLITIAGARRGSKDFCRWVARLRLTNDRGR